MAFVNLLHDEGTFPRLWILSPIKESFHVFESFPQLRKLSTYLNSFLDPGTFPQMWIFSWNKELFYACKAFSRAEKELDRYHKNKSWSCLTTNQLKTQRLRKLKTFQKIHKTLGIKSKCAFGQLQKQPREVFCK